MAKTTTNLNAQDRVRLDAENDIFVHRPKRWRNRAEKACRFADQMNDEASKQAMLRIAADVGYESEAAFNRAFKRETGLTPGRWRDGAEQAAV